VVNGEDKKFTTMPELPGTGIAFSLDTRVAVDLQDTWIARVDPTAGARTGRQTATRTPPPPPPLDQLADGHTIDVARACTSTGMRGPAQRLREQVQRQLMTDSAPLMLDFRDVKDTTSSFLDELLGRLALSMGPDLFARRIRVVGMLVLVEDMAEVVIRQRTEGAIGLPLRRDGGAAS
jgi:hypothetical protein